ncbi:uncharacterized protein LOC124203884 isoform X2 [Daphnia pulex]|uniref:uncharacterized protein LOC124203884 isoform X2 n=1 Tax=Daphnia pulex TaxID=6669 RepID=UPI001EE00589|nr:uncharacterized protein LOC124203884 isoform X2 [Daphnia pulex]
MINFTRICLLMVLMLWTSGPTSAAFSIEEEILQLKLKVVQLEAKDAEMEGKISELELKNVKMEEKVTQLETRNGQLETKVKDQEKMLTLLKASELAISVTGLKSIFNNVDNAIESTGRSGIPRTCRELRAIDPSLSSGMHWIDPDGQGVGDDPIYVYCDMASGSTSILHDSETAIDVGHCADPGCYSRAINYNASMKQMESLIALSSECHQFIKYDCICASFEYDNTQYAWWNDRDGNAQYFWAGNKTNGIHTCQCGIDKNCVDSSLKCNCDQASQDELVDEGLITDKNVLPVIRLNFGRTQFGGGIHTLGQLECSGSIAVNGLPTSCEDLWRIGHSLNGLYFVMEDELVKNVYCNFTKFFSEAGFQSLIGYSEVKTKPTYFGMPTSCDDLERAGHSSSGFYSIKGSAMIESVFCDFTKHPSDEGFEKWIGYADVKSAPVHFYVQRNSSFDYEGTPIPFDLARVNEGNAMDLRSGIFTAPRPGIYFFSFTGHAFIYSSVYVGFDFRLYLNGNRIGSSEVDEYNAPVYQQSPLTLQSTLNLKIGDQLWVELVYTDGSSSYLYDNNLYHYTHFTGFMLDEEIVASL